MIENELKLAREASRILNRTSEEELNNILRDLATAIRDNVPALLEANRRDLDRMDPKNPKYDRLALDAERLRGIASDMDSVASLPSPLGVTLSEWDRPGGMHIRKVSVPFGVIGVVYEARPNVTFDVFSLCLKAGSAVLLKGGSDAVETNTEAVRLIHEVLAAHSLPASAATLLPTDHAATLEMLRAVGDVDLVIPRGSRRLIDFVRDNALVPVIETGAGVCHTYFHSSGRLDYATRMVLNAKTRRVSVCNALDTLVVDAARLGELGELCAPLASSDVEIYADPRAYGALEGKYPFLHHATAEDYGREWLDYKMTVVTVDGLEDAIEYITRYGSKHSEAIVAEDPDAVSRFERDVDAACVYVNVSTAFTDGGQFGFGAEIGISTQKLHARGPMALPEITTYKYLITGPGLTR